MLLYLQPSALSVGIYNVSSLEIFLKAPKMLLISSSTKSFSEKFIKFLREASLQPYLSDLIFFC